MGVQSRIMKSAAGLEKRLTVQFSDALNSQDLDKVASLFLEAYPHVLGLTSRFVPTEALDELEQKYDCNFPDGSGIYYGEEDQKTKNAIREERYSLEAKLLKAKHPKKIERLWAEAKPVLMEMYHRHFNDRMDVAIMNSHYLARKSLVSRFRNVQHALGYLHLVEAQLYLGDPWEKIAEMWKSDYIEPMMHGAAENMLSLLGALRQDTTQIRRGILRHKKEKDEDHDDDPSWYREFDFSELSEAGVHAELPRGTQRLPFWRAYHSPNELKYMTRLILEDKEKPISFRQAFILYNSRTAREIGFDTIDGEYWFGDRTPEELSDLIMRGLKSAYDNRKPGDEIYKYLDWVVPIALERWKGTAPDYQKVFRWHEASPQLRYFMATFYSVKEGEPIEYKDDKIVIGRLPMLLRDLLADGLITNEQIDPPLEEHYLLPDEIVGGPHCRVLDVAKRLMTHITTNVATIDSSVNPRLLLPLPEGQNQLPELRDDLSGLAGILDPTKSYELLYSGDTCVFVGMMYQLPGGEKRFSELYRFTKLCSGVVPKDGATVRIAGHDVHVTKQRDDSVEDFARDHMYDTDSDMLPAKQFIVMTDKPVDEFAAKYFRDFLALAFIHRPGLLHDVKTDIRLLSDIPLEQLLLRYPVARISAGLGETNRAHLKTFEIDGRFGFSLEYDGIFKSEIFSIGNTLISFLKESGIGIYTKADLDESGRAVHQMKIENRAFYEEHRVEMVQQLQGRGLLNALAYVVGEQKKYDIKDFGIKTTPCKECGKHYFTGWIHPEGQDDYHGFRTRALHDLAYHPETLSTKFDQIKRIHEFLTDARESEVVPAFVQYPSLIPMMRSFIHAYEQEVKWSSAGFGVYMDHQGSVDLWHEEEEIAEDPALQKMKAYEEKIDTLEQLSGLILRVTAKHLQQKYERLQGLEPKEYDPDPAFFSMTDIERFWSRQVMLYTIYQTITPELLPAPGEGSVKELPEPIKVIWG